MPRKGRGFCGAWCGHGLVEVTPDSLPRPTAFIMSVTVNDDSDPFRDSRRHSHAIGLAKCLQRTADGCSPQVRQTMTLKTPPLNSGRCG